MHEIIQVKAMVYMSYCNAHRYKNRFHFTGTQINDLKAENYQWIPFAGFRKIPIFAQLSDFKYYRRPVLS